MRYIKYLWLYVFVIMFNHIYAQTESPITKDSIYIFSVQCDSWYNQPGICPVNSGRFITPDILPQFPGGDQELMNFLRNHIEYPLECKEKGIQGRVVVEFIIDELGEVICQRIRRSIHPRLDEEALRVVKLMPNWKPASRNGYPCKTCYTLPILFK